MKSHSDATGGRVEGHWRKAVCVNKIQIRSKSGTAMCWRKEWNEETECGCLRSNVFPAKERSDWELYLEL